MISINVDDYCEVCWMRPFFKITWINSYPVTQKSTLKLLPGKVKFPVIIGFSSNKPAPFLGPLCIVCSLYWERKENRADQPQQKGPYQQYKQWQLSKLCPDCCDSVMVSASKYLWLTGSEMGQLLEGCGVFYAGGGTILQGFFKALGVTELSCIWRMLKTVTRIHLKSLWKCTD